MLHESLPGCWISTEKIVNPDGYVTTLTQQQTLVTCLLRCKVVVPTCAGKTAAPVIYLIIE